jgi:hypothetical protein
MACECFNAAQPREPHYSAQRLDYGLLLSNGSSWMIPEERASSSTSAAIQTPRGCRR